MGEDACITKVRVLVQPFGLQVSNVKVMEGAMGVTEALAWFNTILNQKIQLHAKSYLKIFFFHRMLKAARFSLIPLDS